MLNKLAYMQIFYSGPKSDLLECLVFNNLLRAKLSWNRIIRRHGGWGGGETESFDRKKAWPSYKSLNTLWFLSNWREVGKRTYLRLSPSTKSLYFSPAVLLSSRWITARDTVGRPCNITSLNQLPARAKDPDPHNFWKLDPDPHYFWKLDPDPHHLWKLDPDPH